MTISKYEVEVFTVSHETYEMSYVLKWNKMDMKMIVDSYAVTLFVVILVSALPLFLQLLCSFQPS